MTWAKRCAVLLFFACGGLTASPDPLYEGFRTPPPRYSPMPIWYWNAEIQPDEAKRQIDEYIRQGAQGAIVYPGVGLGTRFLSKEWWQIWAELLPYARQKAFKLGWNPEFNHPTGDARDVWLDPPEQSLVLKGHPEYRMRRLTYVEKEFTGPGIARFESLPNPVIAIAARRPRPGSLDADTLSDMSKSIQGGRFEAVLAGGEWLLMFFYVEETEGSTHRQIRVDPLNADATRRYLDLTLGEFARRFPEHVGTTLTFALLDSEGCYGGPIVWTPQFFDAFQARKGYDMRRFLPLLVHDGGNVTPKIRNDYFQVVSQLFVENYWKLAGDWGAAHGVEVVGQSWGDSLQMEPAYGADFMATHRALTLPALENLFDEFRDPRQFKEIQSIAHFENKRLWCECQLVQGVESYISPQKMRYGANVIGAWGVNFWSQNTSYDDNRPEWPPSMGRSQPHWKFFHHYADLLRRISYMNDGGRHVAGTLLFKPLSTVVAYSDPVFDSVLRNYKGRQGSGFAVFGDEAYGGARLVWGGDFSAKVEIAYHAMMQSLAMRHQDFDVADDFYIERAGIEGGKVRLGEEEFGAVVLPPMKIISRSTLQKIRRFYDEGGVVIAYGGLPSGSPETGWSDPEIVAGVRSIFGVGPDREQDAESRNGRGGRSFFVARDVDSIASILERVRRPDFKIVEGAPEHLFYMHRVKDGREIYWVVNDSAARRKLVVSLAAEGTPELWDPVDGSRRPVAYASNGGGTTLTLDMEGWDGRYVVFSPPGTGPSFKVASTNLEGLAIEETSGGLALTGHPPDAVQEAFAEGEWRGRPFRVKQPLAPPLAPQTLDPRGWTFRPLADKVKAHYARQTLAPMGEGVKLGFTDPAFNDHPWQFEWLSRQRWTIREWNVAGPFPNPDHQGFNHSYPPEQGIDLKAGYVGFGDEKVAWRKYRSPTPEVNFTEALGLPDREGVEYALTYVHVPSARTAKAFLAAENAKLWVNGALVKQFHYMPRYYELRDEFAIKAMLPLTAGWNQILVKIEHCSTPYYRHRPIVFSLRLSESAGLPIPDLLTAFEPADAERLWQVRGQAVAEMERWYRISIPPGTTAALLPAVPGVLGVYVNGEKKDPVPGGRVPLGTLDWDRKNVLALRMAAANELPDFPEFAAGESLYRLGSWTGTGLSYFSGEAAYEKMFELDPKLIGVEVELDLGQVGLTAEVWLNDVKIGERVWAPFRLDVTAYLRPGANRLKVAVTNSDANARAEASTERYLERKKLNLMPNVFPHMDSLGLNGLLGPVQLVPIRQARLALSP